MKPAELRSMTEDQLTKLETELHVEWRNLRFQESVGQLTNNARIRTIRKDLARILTIRHERVLDAELGN
ncbi:MAG: 50S ribosomal protein L29 [Thermomicrobiales bacterium]|nr:MAG: 50S ribosomal protein L29 [Thermomicrobiales bacterium]